MFWFMNSYLSGEHKENATIIVLLPFFCCQVDWDLIVNAMFHWFDCPPSPPKDVYLNQNLLSKKDPENVGMLKGLA